MRILRKTLISAAFAGLALFSLDAVQADAGQLSRASDIVALSAKGPIRVSGRASVVLKADKLSVNVSVAVVSDSIDGVIATLKERRSEVSSKAGGGDLTVVSAEIRSLNINKARRDGPQYNGTMQLAVIVSGFDDALTAVGQIADDKVTRVDSLRYGFSEKLLEQTDLCEMALADARKKADKQAKAAGKTLGRMLQQWCNEGGQRSNYFSSEPERLITVSASAAFEQLDE